LGLLLDEPLLLLYDLQQCLHLRQVRKGNTRMLLESLLPGASKHIQQLTCLGL